ncbi:hypothetical protein JTE90_026186 [Oedothorax gibbosus]|uniref:PDZ domain-containing protein n=1 Tax=Oedothorax gibbosus TaxID=931172 RepID=A0AAV6UGP6_9ARAC|nr:hypothetical protein JTE90_026186 [Oedothorax gibbosus]
MAFQRPFLISLKRQDSNLRWGFGIKGGRDYSEPLLVQTVGESSLAETCGLREGDEIIQVGRINVQDLTLGQAHEVLARCGNKIEMFVVREDLLTSKKGKEPATVKAVVHNPYNSPLSLYSTENIAETLAKQTEVLTEGQVSTEEDEGPENLSFKQKSAVFALLEEQAKQEGSVPTRVATQTVQVKKPTAAPPPPPKPKPPSNEHIYNGYDHQVYHQDQGKTTSRVEYQTTQKVVDQYYYQQEQPTQYQQQSSVYQYQSSSPGYQSPPIRGSNQAPVYQSSVSFESKKSPTPSQNQNYQQLNQNYQQQNQIYHQQQNQNYQQHNQNYHQQNQSYQQQKQHSQSYQQPVQSSQASVNLNQQQYSGPKSPTYEPLNQVNYKKGQQEKSQSHHQVQAQQQNKYQQPKTTQAPQSTVSRAEIKVGPPPPPRSTDHDSTMTAVYKQQYEQHLQKQYEQQQQMMLNAEEDLNKPRAHIIDEDIFEHNCTSGTPITYKAPPAAPPKPVWPPPASSGQHERFRSPHLDSPPNGLIKNVDQVWPPKASSTTELPRQGFNPAAVREQSGSGRRCVWPPADEHRTSGRSTPLSPVTGRRIQWNPSPSPPTTRRAYNSPSRRKDVQWPPPEGAMRQMNGGPPRPSPRMSRKSQFDDYIHEHASINVPQTYRPPPGTQHIEFR